MTLSRRSFLGLSALSLAPGALGATRLRAAEGLLASRDSGEGLHPTSGASSEAGVPTDRFDPWVEVIPSHVHEAVDAVSHLVSARPILAVVKNNGYGLELELVAKLLHEQPAIQGFAVVKGEEALKLRAAGITKPILLMGMFSAEEGRELAEAGVEFGVFTPDAADRLLPLARATGRPLGIHQYLDTGMGRMGMDFRKALPWMEELGRHGEIQVRGTFTELGEDPAFDMEQIKRFLDLADEARNRGLETGLLHAASSNGVFHLPAGHLDLVRPGIALFGSYPSRPDEERKLASLRTALRLNARVVRVAQIQPGEGVGYGRPWIAEEPTWVATLPIGHADGYPREAPNGAQVLIRDRPYPVIGGVSASHSIVNLGAHRSAQVGDVATLMGPDHPAIDPNNMAETLGVSVYDLLMHVNPSLPRFVTED